MLTVKRTLCPDVWLPWTGLAITPVPAADPGQYDASDESEEVAFPRYETAERQQSEEQPTVEDGHSHGDQDRHEAPFEEPARDEVSEVAEHQAARANVDSVSSHQPDARAREHRNEDRDCQQRTRSTHAHKASQHQQGAGVGQQVEEAVVYENMEGYAQYTRAVPRDDSEPVEVKAGEVVESSDNPKQSDEPEKPDERAHSDYPFC